MNINNDREKLFSKLYNFEYVYINFDRNNVYSDFNIGDLYIDIYADNMHSISLIAKRFRKIVSSKMEILLNYEGQHYSGVNGVYKYRLIYNPLIDGE